jgi:UDP-N-acetylglucosamine diphosphorylase/glucosamine-1-phosphate N-acetyltransferase
MADTTPGKQDLGAGICVVVLAAGKGTRMKSDKAKVLHEVGGRPMVLYIIEAARAVVGERIVVVVGHQADVVEQVISSQHVVRFCRQQCQLGTGHAVKEALPYLMAGTQHVVILCGDTPLVTADTLRRLIADHLGFKRDLTLLAVTMDRPTGYGRVLFDADHRVLGIVEEADADETQKRIRLVNTGIYCVRTDFLAEALNRIRPDNAQGEYYLTDLAEIGHRQGRRVGGLIGDDPLEVVGINSMDDLSRAESIVRARLAKTA